MRSVVLTSVFWIGAWLFWAWPSSEFKFYWPGLYRLCWADGKCEEFPVRAPSFYRFSRHSFDRVFSKPTSVERVR